MPPAAVLQNEFRFESRTAVRIGIGFGDLTSESGHGGCGPLPADARFQAAQYFKPREIPAARAEQRIKLPGRRDLALHHDRDVNVRRDAGDCAGELWRRDTNHGKVDAVQINRLPHQPWVGSKATLPQPVTEHDYRMRATGLIFFRQEAAP